ncbi:hypothetical protein SUGI_0395810 [Cryptomeria japonica]|uniref:uncharacterized protein LOC131047558 isoform X2 n=1 Tax=Cryptomeria japonica TaxID=3369 RepID=UPI002408EAD7|nr:uncharacterized protein LOC131047558 isoform X2 [Cryptomeria japonica]GLJ21458.1 hypothetical protein SUGI_0395810 [Cryptomeria japonica]
MNRRLSESPEALLNIQANILLFDMQRSTVMEEREKGKSKVFDSTARLRGNPIRHKETIRIGCGAGFRGDRPVAALQLLQRVPNLDYLVLECLAERTLALRYDIMMSGGHGYDSRISEWMSVLLPSAVERGVCIITNMGAMDAIGAQEEVLRVAKRLSLSITVAVVYETFMIRTGSDALVSDPRCAPGGVSTYLGAAPIVHALEESKPHIIITTRLADAALFLGPMVYELGWNWNEFDKLAQGTLAGHLLECGCQLTGGYYMHPADPHRNFSFQQLLDVSLPFADITFDGKVYLGKAENSGGEISFRTCAQQLLYEVGDPSEYITPDVVVNFQNVFFSPLSKDLVLAEGAEANILERPERLLQLVPQECGWKGWGEISYGGLGCVKRATAADYLVRSWIEQMYHGTQDHIVSYIIGVDSLQAHSADLHPLSTGEPMDIRLRMDGLFSSKDHAVHFTQECEALYTNGPAGGGGISTGVKKETFLQKILVPRENTYWEFDIKSINPSDSQCENRHAMNLKDVEIPPLKHNRGLEQTQSVEKTIDFSNPPWSIPTRPAPAGEKIPLYQVAHSRAGDKGNDLNFSIIPHFLADIERLKKVITVEWVKNVITILMTPNAIRMVQHSEDLHFEDNAPFKNMGKDLPEYNEALTVEIYEAKGIKSLNIVVRNALDGGVNCSRRIDRHGKTTSDLILAQEIVLPP